MEELCAKSNMVIYFRLALIGRGNKNEGYSNNNNKNTDR